MSSMACSWEDGYLQVERLNCLPIEVGVPQHSDMFARNSSTFVRSFFRCVGLVPYICHLSFCVTELFEEC